jgi:glutathione reductase (NADPH)
MVVHGAGRVPALEALRPEKGGIPLQKGRIEVNQYLQSVENPAVYVAGDALGQGPQLTPVAEMEGRVAGRNIVEGNRSFPDYRVVPSVAFTMPPIASVGMQEKAARGSDREVNILYRDTSNRHITRRHGLSHSGMKVITEKATGQILGAHLLGHNADEVINFFALAMARRLSIQDISDVITTFPSVTYDALFRIR